MKILKLAVCAALPLVLALVLALPSTVSADTATFVMSSPVKVGFAMVKCKGNARCGKGYFEIAESDYIALGSPINATYVFYNKGMAFEHFETTTAIVYNASNNTYWAEKTSSHNRHASLNPGYTMFKICLDDVCQQGPTIYDGSSSGGYQYVTYNMEL